MRNASYRIVLADDHLVVRDGLAMILEREPDLTIVAAAVDGAEAIALYRQHRPDLLILDLRMPQVDGLEVVRTLTAEGEPNILILTTYDNDMDLRRALQAGAKGYLLKDADREEILEAVREVATGRNFLPASLASRLGFSQNQKELTPRELDVLLQMSTGKANKEIGSALSIGEGTVKSHVKAILEKLNCVSRTEAVTTAIQRGLIRISN